MMRFKTLCATAAGAALALMATAPGSAIASEPANSVGNIGLLQTPTARFSGAGTVRIGAFRAPPLNVVALSAQPYDWLETTYRYTRFRYDGVLDDATADGTIDKSFDVKVGLLGESRWLPAVAVGIQDVGGTGLLSGEFLVASKRIYDFDLTLGMGWGRMGARGDFDNPLSALDEGFDDRDSDTTGKGGKFEVDQFFRGESVALFGGIRWSPEDSRWSVVIEREGNDYSMEPFGNDLQVDWPVNVGLAYQAEGYGLRAGYERGDQLTLGAYLSFDLSKPGPAKVLDASPTPVAPPGVDGSYEPASQGGQADRAKSQREQDIRRALRRQDITLIRLERDGPVFNAWISQQRYRTELSAADRTARTLSMLAAPEVKTLRVISVAAGIEQARVVLDRATVRALASAQPDTADTLKPPRLERPSLTVVHDDPALPDGLTDIQWSSAPRYVQSLGDPDEAYRAHLFWRFGVTKRWSAYLDTSAAAEVGIIGNLDKIERESDSQLPRVRSDVAKYFDEGEHGLRKLETNYIRPLGGDWHGRLSAGIFEAMYGGVAAELLYRPFGQSWAVGANVNRVRQRDFDQRLSFRDYEVTTGHLTLYTGYAPLAMDAELSVGCYLAGDCGGTVQLARTFKTGASVGFFATKTNVSSEEFGEGSFDKGFFLEMPFDLFLPRSSQRKARAAFRPLTRDGGQMVRDGRSLIDATERRSVDLGQ